MSDSLSSGTPAVFHPFFLLLMVGSVQALSENLSLKSAAVRWFESIGIRPERQRQVLVVLGFALLGLLSAFFWYRLGFGDLKDWDESVYAWRALVIHELGGVYWFDQSQFAWLGHYSGAFPPLLVWTSAINFHLFGVNEFSHRMFSTLMGCLSLFGLYFLGRALRSRLAGVLAGVALATIFFWVRFARRGQFDVPFTGFTIWALAFYAEALFRSVGRRQRIMLLGAGVMLGLGLMTKILITGILAGGIAFLFSLYLLATGRRSLRRLLLDAGLMLLPALIIVAPWHIYMTFQANHEEFWWYYVVFHLLNRTTTVLDFHQHPWYYYFSMMWAEIPNVTLILGVGGLAFFLWRFFAKGLRRPFGPAAASSARASIEDQRLHVSDQGAVAFLALLILVFPIVLYVSATTRRDAYLLPQLPGVALMAGMFLAYLIEETIAFYGVLGVIFYVGVGYSWHQHEEWSESLNLALALNPGFLFTGEGIDFLVHTLGYIVAGAAVGVAAIGTAAFFWKPLRRWLPAMAAFVILGLFAYEGYADGAKNMVDPYKGRRTFGWYGVRPYTHSRAYDKILYFSGYTEPAKCFYLYGAEWYAIDPGLTFMTNDAEDFATTLATVDNPLVLIDRAERAHLLQEVEPHLADLQFLFRAGMLELYAKPGSGFARYYEEHPLEHPPYAVGGEIGAGTEALTE